MKRVVVGAIYLYCKTDRRENPFAAQNRLFSNKGNSGAAKDWNDSGGQRPAQIQVKSKKQKGKIIQSYLAFFKIKERGQRS